MNAVLMDPIGGLAVALHRRKVDEVFGASADLLSKRGVVVGREAVAEDLDVFAVMQAGQRLHQVGRRVIAEVRGHVADLQSLSGLESQLEFVGLLVQDADLLQAEHGVSVGDALPVLVGQRVQHGVMRVNRRQPILVQLIGHDGHQGLLSGHVVRPVADDLQTVGQVAVRVREVGLQFQSRAIGLDGLGDVAGVLVNRGQIRMGVREGRIDLYGPCVALQGPLDVLHLLEGVAHIGIGIGERRLNPECKNKGGH